MGIYVIVESMKENDKKSIGMVIPTCMYFLRKNLQGRDLCGVQEKSGDN